MNSYDVIVLGAGAAGLMCALTAGQQGQRVLVLERANKVGKKILMSGGGRCNFTNLHIEPQRYLSANPHYCKSALKQYTQWDFISLVERHGIAYHEKEQGQLFCDQSSKQIVQLLLDECADGAVDIRLNCEVSEVQHSDGRFILSTAEQTCDAARLVVATGGLSIPKMGGSGFGYSLAEQFGLNLLPRTAGLVPLTFTDQHQSMFAELSGVSVAADVSTAGQHFANQVLFTHRGLSGPAILQISSYWQPGTALCVDLMPADDAASLLLELKRQQPELTLAQCLQRYWPKKLVSEFMAREAADLQPAQPLHHLSDSRCRQLGELLNQWQLKPAATEGYRTAEVTLGGVDTRELSSRSMVCQSVPGLYFIGEVVDVTGHLGGFNFQWAWSSAYAAARDICETRASA